MAALSHGACAWLTGRLTAHPDKAVMGHGGKGGNVAGSPQDKKFLDALLGERVYWSRFVSF